MIDNCRYLGSSRVPRKIVLVEVSLDLRFWQFFDKQYIFICLISTGEALSGKGLFL